MKRGNSRRQRLTALLLAAWTAVSLTPVPASAAVSVHFADVPSHHWAYPYVERAYQDGAIAGTGGDPAEGSGVFSPGTKMTYGQFLTMLASAFYPEELAKSRQADDLWYVPAIRLAASRKLSRLEEDQLMVYSGVAVSRYDAAWIVTRVLEDRNAVMPSQEERESAAARIGDWSQVAEDPLWEYCVSTVFAAGIISGIDERGTFAGNGTITRDAAAVIYTRLADKLNAGRAEVPRQKYRLLYNTGWELITVPGYQEELEEVFYEVYPRLAARWGGEAVQRTIRVQVEESLTSKSTGKESIMITTSTQSGSLIRISAKLQERYPASHSIAHELVHVTQDNYPSSYQSTWWDECLADYGQFRYYRWAEAEHVTREDRYRADDPDLRGWRYQAYGDSLWFFAYLDARYPTTPQGYGLIDSIHYGILAGQVAGDDPEDPTFNAVVQTVTGFDTIEQLRQRYVQELDAGTWTFRGFGDYADNYITENIPGVPNPSYPTPEDIK